MTISPADLHAREASKTLVLDVRAPGEFAAGHLPGAVNLPLDSIAALLPELADAAGRRELFVVCATGRRSADARERLSDAGIAATGVEGGTEGWTAAGLPVEQGPTPARAIWAMDRQVRFAAGSLVLAGLTLGRRAPRARLLSAGVATGLVYSGLSNTCGMAALLGKLPFNRPEPAVLDTARAALRA